MLWNARPSCLRLFWHLARAAASRTFCTAGRSKPMSTAMMAMTTSSSISVNADRRGEDERTINLPILERGAYDNQPSGTEDTSLQRLGRHPRRAVGAIGL